MMHTSFSKSRVLLLLSLSFIALVSTLALFGTMAHPTQAAPTATYVTDPIITNTTWTVAGSPYIIADDDVQIQPGVTLTIEPGVIVMGQTDTSLFVEGNLQAIGIPTDPITFTSQNGIPGGWQGLYAGASGTAYLSDAVIENAVMGLDIEGASGGSVQLENSVVRDTTGYPIFLFIDSWHRLQMSDVTFANNTLNRVVIEVENLDLADDVTLTNQPGLEGYQIGTPEGGFSGFIIPTGITLTLEEGSTLMFPSSNYGGIEVNGTLEALGTAESPVMFTTPDNLPGDWNIYSIFGEKIHLRHAIIRHADTGLYIPDNHNGPLILENSSIEESSGYPLTIETGALHRLQMSNATFANNNPNRILIVTEGSDFALAENVTLTNQPGLEGYQVGTDFGGSAYLEVPSGLTLTLEPGTTLMFSNDEAGGLGVNGTVIALGTADSPITFRATDNTPGEWNGIRASDSANIHLRHTTIRHAKAALGIEGSSGGSIIIEDSVIQDSPFHPLGITADALHRLQMSNVTFIDNNPNRILISSDYDEPPVVDVTLTKQPGLEGYEISQYGDEVLFIPNGITLTVEPDVTIMFPNNNFAVLIVEGHLEAAGTADSPILFTTADNVPGQWEGIYVDAGASTHLSHAMVRYGGFGIAGQTGGAVLLEESSIQERSYYPIGIEIEALHRLQMSQVVFANNSPNRVLIETNYDNPLVEDVTLTNQPGLEGYEIVAEFQGSPILRVSSGITLTLEPGVTMMFQNSDWGQMIVEGHLEAAGTAESPVTFTSSANTGAGEWAGIVLAGGTAELAHTTVRYADTGIAVQDGQVTAVCSTIANNQGDGIYVDSTGNPSVTISGSTIADNGGEGLNNDNPTQVEARYNYWGAADGPGGEGPGSGDEVSGNILYTPWLPQSACDPSVFVDLETHKTASADTILAGSLLTYTVAITNHSNTTATAVTLTDTLPLSITLVNSPANCTGTMTLTCYLGNLPGNSSTSLSYAVMVSQTAVGPITNTASVSAAQPDLNPTNNSDSAVVTVVELPTLSFGGQVEFAVKEGAETAVFTLTLDIAPALTVTVQYATEGGTAVPNLDYIPVSGTLTFAPGTTEQTFTIPLLDDMLPDGDKTVQIVLSDVENALLGLETAVLTIQDNEGVYLMYLPVVKRP